MNNLNYVFFEEFKRLEKLCNEIYKVHNGITCYIDDMTAAYNNYYNVPNWQSDLKQLKRLRHIRNNLAHEEGAFSQNLCTQNDVEWVRTFYQRILNQSDPLSIQSRSSQTYKAPIVTFPKSNTTYTSTIRYSNPNTYNTPTEPFLPDRETYESYHSSALSRIIATSIWIIVILVILAILMV